MLNTLTVKTNPALFQESLELLLAELKTHFRESLKLVVLYGSVARGDYDDDSDIDILVVIDTLEERYKLTPALTDIANSLFEKYDLWFSILSETLEYHLKYRDLLPFHRNVFNEGRILYGKL